MPGQLEHQLDAERYFHHVVAFAGRLADHFIVGGALPEGGAAYRHQPQYFQDFANAVAAEGSAAILVQQVLGILVVQKFLTSLGWG